MTDSSSIKSLLSASNLRWLALAGVVGTCLGLAVVGARTRREDGARPQAGGAVLAMQGFRTSMYDNDRLQLRVSGDSLTVSNAKLLGPFRLGFAHSLTVRNVTVETFRGAETHSEPVTYTLSSLNRILAPLTPKRVSATIAQAELGPLKIIQHQGARAMVILEAVACQTKQGGAKVVCKDGVIHEDGNEVPFRELTYDGRSRTLRTTQ